MPGFAALYASAGRLAVQSLALRRADVGPVPLSLLLNVRDSLAQFRQKLQEQDCDAESSFTLDAQIMQLDALHCSLTSDRCPFLQKPAGGRYSSKVIVTAVQSCCLLRDAGNLEKQMKHSIQLILPDQASELLQAIDRGLLKAPSPSSVSRWRVAVDTGFMYVMRRLVSDADAAGFAVRCVLADSSPQRKFDWLLTETHTLAPSDVVRWLQSVWGLANTRSRLFRLLAACDDAIQGQDIAQLQEDVRLLQHQRTAAQQELQECAGPCGQPAVDVHLCPPTAQGSRRTQLIHKVHAILHTLRLEIGSWSKVAKFLRAVRAVTTDYGTESGLADVRDINISALFPWTVDSPDFDELQHEDLGARDQAAPAECPGPGLEMRGNQVFLPKLFPLALQCPGALHVLHQSVAELTSSFSVFGDWFYPGLQAVTHVFGKKHNRDGSLQKSCVAPKQAILNHR